MTMSVTGKTKNTNGGKKMKMASYTSYKKSTFKRLLTNDFLYMAIMWCAIVHELIRLTQ
jgi:hypothetical protein